MYFTKVKLEKKNSERTRKTALCYKLKHDIVFILDYICEICHGLSLCS